MSVCRLFRCDLPRVFDWRNFLPIVRHYFFLSNLGHSRYFIYIFLLFSLRASYRSPSESRFVTLSIHSFYLRTAWRERYSLCGVVARCYPSTVVARGNVVPGWLTSCRRSSYTLILRSGFRGQRIRFVVFPAGEGRSCKVLERRQLHGLLRKVWPWVAAKAVKDDEDIPFSLRDWHRNKIHVDDVFFHVYRDRLASVAVCHSFLSAWHKFRRIQCMLRCLLFLYSHQ